MAFSAPRYLYVESRLGRRFDFHLRWVARFTTLPPLYFLVVGVMVAAYLALAETAKALFYRWIRPVRSLSAALAHPERRAHRIQTYRWGKRPAA